MLQSRRTVGGLSCGVRLKALRALSLQSAGVGVLEQAGLVTTEKVGRVRTCKLGLRRLEEEAMWIERYRQLWDARFDELDKLSRD